MQGNPVVRLFVVLAVFVATALPVWWVTRADVARAEEAAPWRANGQGEPAAAQPGSAAREFRLELTWTGQPKQVWVTVLHRRVFDTASIPAPAAPPAGSRLSAEAVFTLDAVPPEGVDFVVRADWPPGTPPSAVRVALQSGSARREATFWTSSVPGLADVLTFKP